MAPRVADHAVWRFVDALAWNWVIAGTDAHAKNYSLLLAGARVRLAPLYDIASALPYGMHERKVRFAMKTGGDYRVFLHRNTWRQAAAELDIDPAATIARIEALAGRAPEAFAAAASSAAIRSLERDLPGRLVDLVAAWAARCIQLLRMT